MKGTINLAILPLLKHTSVDVFVFLGSVMVSRLKLGSFCDNPFRDNMFPLLEHLLFFLRGREYKIIALYFFAFDNIYKTLILFN